MKYILYPNLTVLSTGSVITEKIEYESESDIPLCRHHDDAIERKLITSFIRKSCSECDWPDSPEALAGVVTYTCPEHSSEVREVIFK